MTEKFSPLTEQVLYCHRKGLLEDDAGAAILRIYRAGVCDKTIAAMVERRVSKHRIHEAFHGAVPFRTPKLTAGDYVIGHGAKGNELRSSIQYLNAHSLMVSGSGGGKTVLARIRALQIAGHVEGMFLWDLRKREFAVLRPLLSRLGIDLVVIPARDLRINPLQLPLGVDVSDWIPRVADMLIGVLELPPRASKLLQSKLFPLYRRFAGRPREFPTLFDLYQKIKSDKGSNPQARLAILDSLEPVLLSLGPKVLAYRYGWPSHELARRHLVFELGGVSEVDKNLILNTLILSEFSSRISRGISNPKMNLWICLDEAQRICSSSGQTSAIADLIGLVRGTGIGLDLSLQSTHAVLPQIISNTATKIIGRCGSMADYSAAGNSMGLNADQIQWAQMNLKPGLFIGQLTEGSWRYPFVFRVPNITFPSHVDIGSKETDLGLSTVYASEFENWGYAAEIHSSPTCEPKPSLFQSQQEYLFCKAIVENPMLASSKYPKLAGISSKTAGPLRPKLIAQGLVREHVLDSGGRGPSSLILEATPKGVTAVQEHESETRRDNS